LSLVPVSLSHAMALMVSISGVRGIAGQSLVPEVVTLYVSAFATLQAGRRIVVGRDSRVSGSWVTSITHGVLLAHGYDVVDVGIVPTPTVQYLTETMGADGGIVITSSHNPEPWNGLKFVDRDGLFLSPEKCKQMFALAGAGKFHCPDYNHTGKLTIDHNAYRKHIDAILALEYIKPEQIRARKFKVVLDTVNGAGGAIMLELLNDLGCEVIGMNIEQSGRFAHPPEPVPEHLSDLCGRVRLEKADLGIAVDPDVDRCVLIDETGKPLGEEYTLALAVEFVLGHCGKRGPVCRNLSSSRANDDIAAKYGCPTYAVPVGEINVANRMVATKAVIGGEGNGGVMLPEIHIGRDAPVAAALTLQHLAIFAGTISQLKATLPQYEIVKLKVSVEGIDAEAAVAHFKEQWQGKEGVSLNDSDGLRIDVEDDKGKWWVHLRKSNTEPIIRVIGEARTTALALQVCHQFMDEIKMFTAKK